MALIFGSVKFFSSSCTRADGSSDPDEKIYGLLAKDFLVKWTNAGDLTIKTHKDDARGKFGRILGELFIGDSSYSINQQMIDEHHAVAYTGGNKEEIEKNILEAIKKAHESSTSTMKERMNDLTGGLNLNLPGLDNNDS